MDQLTSNLLQRVPVLEIILPEEIDSDKLLDTLQKIQSHNPYYVKTFLSSKLFKYPNVDQDEFYDLFSEIIMAKPKDVTDQDLVTYNINGTLININETPRLISGSGTTGLRTWEAALYLSVFLDEKYGDKLQGKGILELGAGTGLVSLSLIRTSELDFKKLVITDGDSNLIEQLTSNFQSNDINLQDSAKDIKCQSLWWGQDQFPNDIDIIIAADVTYDASVIPFLVNCIYDGIVNNGVIEALVAATIRNEDTIKTFEDEVLESDLKYEIVSKVEKPHELKQTVRYSKFSPEIRIYRVFR